MRVLPGLNKVKQDLTNVREYLDIFQKFIVKLQFYWPAKQITLQKGLECQTWKFWQIMETKIGGLAVKALDY